MKVITPSAWGAPKLKGKAKLDALAQSTHDNSEAIVMCSEKYLYIELHGALAAVPNTKNGRVTLPGGASIMGKECRVRIDIMSQIVMTEVEKQGLQLPYFGSEPVSMLLIAGRRSRSFDLVGVMESVQDWLEPATKSVGRNPKPRGWGIGIIDDDQTIIPRVYHSWQTGIAHEHTVISVVPWDSVREKDIDFIATHLTFGGSREVKAK